MKEIERLKVTPSYGWWLKMLAFTDGLHMVFQWDDENTRFEYPGFAWIHFHFESPASWAHLDYSQAWQHVPDGPDSFILQIALHASRQTHLPGIQLNTETFGRDWMTFRIVGFDDAIEVIDRRYPQIRLTKRRPPVLDEGVRVPPP